MLGSEIVKIARQFYSNENNPRWDKQAFFKNIVQGYNFHSSAMISIPEETACILGSILIHLGVSKEELLNNCSVSRLSVMLPKYRLTFNESEWLHRLEDINDRSGSLGEVLGRIESGYAHEDFPIERLATIFQAIQFDQSLACSTTENEVEATVVIKTKKHNEPVLV